MCDRCEDGLIRDMLGPIEDETTISLITQFGRHCATAETYRAHGSFQGEGQQSRMAQCLLKHIIERIGDENE